MDFSPAVQRLESLREKDGRLVALFTSSTSEPVLYKAIHGHATGGVATCPTSVSADMAYTAARWLYTEASLDVDLAHLRLKDLNMMQALRVPKGDPSRTVRITATLNIESRVVHVHFQSSVDGTVPRDLTYHGSTVVTVEDPVLAQKQWNQMRRLLLARVSALKKSLRAHRMATSLFYKLSANVMEYTHAYQVLDQVAIEDTFEDATAIIELGQKQEPGTNGFTVNPFVFDGLIHLAGFLLNINLNKNDKELHIASSIGSIDICQPLACGGQRGIVYASIREQHSRTGISICDVYLCDAETGELLARCNDIQFQQVPLDAFREPIVRKAGDVREAPVHTHFTPAVAATVSQALRGPNGVLQKPASSPKSEILLKLIAAEVGVDVKTLPIDTNFESLGLHSMAALKIVGAFRKHTDFELPIGIFIQHDTVGRLKSALQDMFGEDSKHGLSDYPRTIPGPPPGQIRPAAHVDTKTLRKCSGDDGSQLALERHNQQPTTTSSKPVPEGRAVLIQGDSTVCLPPLFLVSVGAGTAAPYIRFPRLPGGRCIYALESPFVDDPQHHPQSVEIMAELWTQSIKRLSRGGPYIIGGWSIGGAYAYEIALQLAVSGDTVLGLIILDCRVPQSVPAAVGHIAMPVDAPGLTAKEREHMTASARTMARYQPKPFPPDHARQPGRTHIIWCQGDESGDEVWGRAAMQPVGSGRDSWTMTFKEYEVELLKWFKGKREDEDFGTNGWEHLVGGKENMAVRIAPGNHETMMEPPHVQRTGELVVEFINDVTKVEGRIELE